MVVPDLRGQDPPKGHQIHLMGCEINNCSEKKKQQFFSLIFDFVVFVFVVCSILDSFKHQIVKVLLKIYVYKFHIVKYA